MTDQQRALMCFNLWIVMIKQKHERGDCTSIELDLYNSSATVRNALIFTEGKKQ